MGESEISNENSESESSESESGNVSISPEDYKALKASAMEGHASRLGFDMDSPVVNLVLEQFYEGGMNDADLVEIGEKYGVLNSNNSDTSESSSSKSDSVQDSGTEARRTLANGDNLPDIGRLPTTSEIVTKTYNDMIEQGTTREEARVAAMDRLLEQRGRVQAVSRIRNRYQDDDLAQTLAAEMAAGE